ncbi:MAG: hypothetical protein ACI81Y_000968 [Glaciecola sp.]|jgi:hypothetical protein
MLSMHLSSFGQFYDGSNQTFGKNRVQYKNFVWQYVRGDRFDTYFYEGGKDLATYVNEQAAEELTAMETKFDFPLDERLNFVVYTTQSDFRQSNIGMVDAEGFNLGGKTQFIGNKLFIYFEGDYAQLDKSIRYGLATVLFNKMIMGGSWTEMIKNSTLIQLPEWYKEGILRYMADPNDQEILSFVKDGIQSGRYKNFNRLEREEATRAGYAMWYYIAQIYGEAIVPNILYMTRVSRNVESGMLYALGIDLQDLIIDQNYYYETLYEGLDAGKKDIELEPLPIKTKEYLKYSQLKSNVDGTKLAYVSNELGQYKIWIYDELSGKRKKIYRGEHKLDRIVDHTYPVLAWNPNNNDLTFVIEKKGELWLYVYSTAEKKIYPRQMVGLDKVLSFDFAQNGKTAIMSGVRFGQTDLYLYYMLGNRQERLTNDRNDDLSPRFVLNDQKVVFASNRDDDTLRFGDKEVETMTQDIFVFDLNNRAANLERITDTPNLSEKYPNQFDDRRYTYLGDNNGIYNRYIAEYDSVISRIDTTIHYRYFTRKAQLSDYKKNVLEYEVNADDGHYTQVLYSEGRYRFYKSKLENLEEIGELKYETKQVESEFFDTKVPSIEVQGKLQVEEETGGIIDINNYQFENDQAIDTTSKVVVFEDFLDMETQVQKDDVVSKKPLSIRSYRVNFAKDYSVTQLTNSFSNKFYQSAIYGSDNLNPGLSPLVKVGLSDLFEDYRIVGGVRFANANNDYGITYDNLLKRMDKQLTFQRQAIKGTIDLDPRPDVENLFFVKLKTHILNYRLKYPFNEVMSLRMSFLGRQESMVFLATNTIDLELENLNSTTVGGKLELVYDNTIQRGLNLYNGTRYKLWTEYYGEYETSFDNIPTFGVAGIDFRHYERIHRDIIFAGRFAGNVSFGSQKLLNFLGGVDNWILPRPTSDVDIPVDLSQNYAYQALISPMRGYIKNARNGTSAAVASAEVRVPLFKYILNRPINSDFIQNFQLIGYGDMGSAWTGDNPYSDDNTFNTIIEDQIPLLIELENQVDPVIKGIGFGMRSRLLGYFIRADWSWGIVDNRFLDRQFYLSFNLDF